MKIAYVITDLGLGGAEVLLVDLANRMSIKGHQVKIITLGNVNKHGDFLHTSIEVLSLSMRKSPLSFVKSLKDYVKIIKNFQPDVVHAHMVHANIFSRIARVFYWVPKLISSAHSNNEGGGLRMLAYRCSDFLSNINTNVSQVACDKFIDEKAFSGIKSFAIYNAIDTNRFVRKDQIGKNIREKYLVSFADFLFVCVGRLTHEKDHSTLIEAFAIMHKRFSNVKLIIVGDGDLFSVLAKLIGNLDLTGSVMLVGAHRDVENWCSAADAFVLSSVVEGFGLVLAEAMSCECPVISTDVGGCPEVLGDRTWIVPSKSPMKMADKMLEMMQLDPRERLDLAFKNRTRVVENFSWDVIESQWIDLYKR